jgi:pSer/pThr/pTyr-binding forkhead associated (FHA) protein
VREKKNGELVFTVRDAPSNTGTFVHNTLVGLKEQVRLESGDIITIGATTMIFSTELEEEA